MKQGAFSPATPRSRLYLALLVAWVALTFTLTSIPNPKVSVDIPFSDKLAHLGFYSVMGFLCAMWRRESGFSARRALLYAVLFVAVLGGVDEVHQHFIPGRSMDLLDWTADAVGGGIGAVFSLLLPQLFPFLITE